MSPALRGLLLAGVLATAAAGESGIVLAARGTAQAEAVAVAATGATVGASTVPWGELAAFALPRPLATGSNGGVALRDGTLLRGQPADVDQGALRWSADNGGPRSDPLATLAAIILGPLDVAVLPGLLAGDPGALLVNGERVGGKLTFLNAEAVGLDTGRRVAQIPRTRVLAVVLARPEPATAARTWLLLANGDRVVAGGAVQAPLAAVVAGWSEGPGRTLLPLAAPKRAAAADRLGAALPVRPGTGFPAQVGGVATPYGVRLPARGEIAWEAAGANHLLAWAACPDGGAPVVASVHVDGNQVWEQTLRPGAPAVPLAIPLRGSAGEVALRAAPEADGETAQRAVLWGMPMLVK